MPRILQPFPWKYSDWLTKFTGLGVGGYVLSWHEKLTASQFWSIVVWFGLHVCLLTFDLAEFIWARYIWIYHPDHNTWIGIAEGLAASRHDEAFTLSTLRPRIEKAFPLLSSRGVDVIVREVVMAVSNRE